MTKSHLLAVMALTLILTGCGNSSEYSASIIEEPEELVFETYSNSEYGFEFQYPSDWEVRQYPDVEGKPLVIAKNEGGDLQDYFIIWPDVLADTPTTSFLKSEEETTIDGVKASKELHIWGSPDEPTSDGYYRLYIKENDRTIEFTIEYPGNDDDFYQKMTDSFKFGGDTNLDL